MRTATEKRFIDACHTAKRIVGLMPRLPKGITPRHMYALDAIVQLQDEEGDTRVSDVATFMRSTRPSVTKLVTELAAAGMVTKTRAADDRRVQMVEVTDKGRRLHKELVSDYHDHLTQVFSVIPDKDMETASAVIEQAYDIMVEDRKKDVR